MGLGFEVVQARTESEIDAAFAALSRDKAQACIRGANRRKQAV
jgi:hypothetical protein